MSFYDFREFSAKPLTYVFNYYAKLSNGRIGFVNTCKPRVMYVTDDKCNELYDRLYKECMRPRQVYNEFCIVLTCNSNNDKSIQIIEPCITSPDLSDVQFIWSKPFGASNCLAVTKNKATGKTGFIIVDYYRYLETVGHIKA